MPQSATNIVAELVRAVVTPDKALGDMLPPSSETGQRVPPFERAPKVSFCGCPSPYPALAPKEDKGRAAVPFGRRTGPQAVGKGELNQPPSDPAAQRIRYVWPYLPEMLACRAISSWRLLTVAPVRRTTVVHR